MKRITPLIKLIPCMALGLTALAGMAAPSWAGNSVYLRSTAGAPWGVNTNETAMDRVFGAGQWSDARYETTNVASLLSPNTSFIYMEGSDKNADELETFLTANKAAIELWVSSGGSLLLNAAPNEGDGMDLGFGGVSLTYALYTDRASAVNASHPIFVGPFTPTGTSWTGTSFGHATVSGGGILPIIKNSDNNDTVLAEKTVGSGHVLFGGMTTNNFHSPTTEAANLRANIISYASKFAAPTVVVNSVVINPAKPQTNSSVTAVVSATGPAGVKLTYSYQWKKNGVDLPGETGRTLDLGKPGAGDRDDSISVEVRAIAGLATSAPVTSASVTVVNASPVANSLSISPTRPNTNSILTATATATDPDGDAIRFVYVWMKNGVKINGEDGSTLDLSKPGNGDNGDSISVLIKARDYSAASAPLTSDSVAIGNNGPSITSLSVTPTAPGTNDLLTATATAVDPDGDAIHFVYVWYKNGVKINGEENATLDLSKPGNGDSGDQITVLVKARDYSAASTPWTSSPVTVSGVFAPAINARRSPSPSGGVS
ncbi:hypothetical protein EON83_14625 [bacterium]|nr:MAG: hypothetical protein EON83_14625 [bacterium]